MHWSILYIGVSTPVPYPSNSLDIRVLLLKQYCTEFHNAVDNISGNKVNGAAPLCSSALLHAHHVVYNSSKAQQLTINSGDRWQRLPFSGGLQT